MYDLDDLLARVADLAQEAIGAVNGQEITWVKYWPYWTETLPYGTTRINRMSVETDLSGDIDLDVYTLGLGLVVGHLTEGVEAEVPTDVYGHIVNLLQFFRAHPELTSTAYPTPPAYLWTQPHGAHLTGIPGGTRTVNAAGVPTPQIVIEFELEVPVLALYDPA